MAQVWTVKGPVDSQDLGMTLIHEHVLFQFDDSRRKQTIDFAVGLLEDAAAKGVKTVVDLTPARRIDWFMEIADRVDVNIVACTGYYVNRMTPPPLAAFSEAQMVDRMVRELTMGIDTTDVRAGIIKVAGVDPELTEWEKQVFRAAAAAQRQTGACIATHAIAGSRRPSLDGRADPFRRRRAIWRASRAMAGRFSSTTSDLSSTHRGRTWSIF